MLNSYINQFDLSFIFIIPKSSNVTVSPSDPTGREKSKELMRDISTTFYISSTLFYHQCYAMFCIRHVYDRDEDSARRNVTLFYNSIGGWSQVARNTEYIQARGMARSLVRYGTVQYVQWLQSQVIDYKAGWLGLGLIPTLRIQRALVYINWYAYGTRSCTAVQRIRHFLLCQSMSYGASRCGVVEAGVDTEGAAGNFSSTNWMIGLLYFDVIGFECRKEETSLRMYSAQRNCQRHGKCNSHPNSSTEVLT
jgi:hypothetical protein